MSAVRADGNATVLDQYWAARLASDRRLIPSRLPAHLRTLHRAVTERAFEAGAEGLILTGSTARGTRTSLSDLDYHLVGGAIDVRDLSGELDVHAVSAQVLSLRTRTGDDFVHWSLRFGLIVFDTAGAIAEAAQLLRIEDLWPDIDRKRSQALKSLDLARRFVATGDESGAADQVRTALSLAGRARLLEVGVFPLSRAELPDQLQSVGHAEVAEHSRALLERGASLLDLSRAVVLAQRMLERRTSTEAGLPPPL